MLDANEDGYDVNAARVARRELWLEEALAA